MKQKKKTTKNPSGKTSSFNRFTENDFHSLCDKLAKRDRAFAEIINDHGYPPLWSRPNTFETLVHIILEQQVSLASALSALNKLKEKIKDITPENVLKLSDKQLKACYFSRQKTAYVRYLATALVEKQLHLPSLENLSDDKVRAQLILLKGVGNWTIDVYLIFVLKRSDVFPIGDLAAVNALKRVKALSKETTHETILAEAAKWQPHRTIATMLLWHYYLSSPVKKIKNKTSDTKKATTMIKIKRIYEPPAAADGYRVLIDRLWPRGMTKEDAKIDKWLKEVAPSTELRKWYDHDPEKWKNFFIKYKKELAGSEALKELQADIRKHKTITFLFSAKNEEYNHALALRDIVEKDRA